MKNDDDITLKISRKKFRLIKNILLEIFIALSFYAPWYTNVWWCLICERKPAAGTFFNTLYFIAACAVFAFFADKWWNLPLMIYSALSAVTFIVGAFFSESVVKDICMFFIGPPFFGFAYINYIVYVTVSCIFSLAMFLLMLRRYRKKSPRHAG